MNKLRQIFISSVQELILQMTDWYFEGIVRNFSFQQLWHLIHFPVHFSKKCLCKFPSQLLRDSVTCILTQAEDALNCCPPYLGKENAIAPPCVV